MDKEAEKACCFTCLLTKMRDCKHCKFNHALPEKTIREEYKRMNQPLTDSFCGKWAALGQYGYPLEYFKSQAEAEKFVIDYYSTRLHLITQNGRSNE